MFNVTVEQTRHSVSSSTAMPSGFLSTSTAANALQDQSGLPNLNDTQLFTKAMQKRETEGEQGLGGGGCLFLTF